MTVDDLALRLAPEGRAAVPNAVKAQLLLRLTEFIKQST